MLNLLPLRPARFYFFRQQTARNVRESIEELETELKEEEEGNEKLAARRFRELMGALDVEENTQELALAILKEEGMQAVQVRAFVRVEPKCSWGVGCRRLSSVWCTRRKRYQVGSMTEFACVLVPSVRSRGVPFDQSIPRLVDWLRRLNSLADPTTGPWGSPGRTTSLGGEVYL